MHQLLVPPHLYAKSCDVAEQIVWLSRLPGGLHLNYDAEAERWIVSAGDRGSWGKVLGQALHHLLLELQSQHREVG